MPVCAAEAAGGDAAEMGRKNDAILHFRRQPHQRMIRRDGLWGEGVKPSACEFAGK